MFSWHVMEPLFIVLKHGYRAHRDGPRPGRYWKVALLVAASSLLLVFPAQEATAGGLRCPQLWDLNLPVHVTDGGPLLPAAPDLSQPFELASAIDVLSGYGLSADSTINYLIAFYCPTVSTQPGLSDDQKRQVMRGFAYQVMRAVLANNSIQDVTFDVSLSPTLAREATAKANQAGLTLKQWINQTVAASVR